MKATRIVALRRCVLLMIASRFTSEAWGPPLERLETVPTRGKSLKAKDDNDQITEDSLSIDVYRTKLELSFDQQPTFDFIQDKADDLVSETFSENFDTDFDCAIPEEWKAQLSDKNQVDVMEFLGIQRAEPLRKFSRRD